MDDGQFQQNIVWRNGHRSVSKRAIASEVAVAISYQGSTQAVLMASPNDLEALAIGFTITEGIVHDIRSIFSTEVLESELGFEVRVDIDEACLENLTKRRRFMAGPVGCGLCGIDSLEQAVRRLPEIGQSDFRVRAEQIGEGLHAMQAGQHLNSQTRAVHAAAVYMPQTEFIMVCEDVGRHNAFDKLIGRSLGHQSVDVMNAAVFVSSRLSVEMVQKAAIFGVPVLIAVSAPTTLALKTAEAAGLTIVAVARGEDFEVFTHPHRITF